MSPRHVAVFDLGKTNAKVVLYDRDRQEEAEVLQQSNETVPGPPYPHYERGRAESVPALFPATPQPCRPIEAIFVSAHGAGIALMAGDELALPVMDYTHEGPDDLTADYDALRPPVALTGAPRMGAGLNLGAQLFWLNRRFPEAAAKVDRLLLWPQFWSWWLSGTAASEVAYASSHSDIWNLQTGEFFPPSLLRAERPDPVSAGAARLRRDRRPAPSLAAEVGAPEGVPVYCGGHDNSLSLISVARDMPMPCTVLSTGTWVTMFALGADEADLPAQPGLMISLDCDGRPTPNFRFPGGQIYADLMAGPDDGAALDYRPGDLQLVGFDQASTARVATASGEHVDLSHIGKADRERTVSLLLAEQTLKGLKAIRARGAIVCSGPFAGNETYLTHIRSHWDHPIHLEENMLGICKGVSACIAGASDA